MHPDNALGALQLATGINKLSPDDTNTGPRGIAHQFGQPARLRYLDVVVKEQQQGAIGNPSPRVSCGSVV